MLCLSVAEARDVYRWVAPDGTVHYADEARPGADRITLPEWAPPKVIRPMAPITPSQADRPAPVVAYEQLAITSPAPEQNIHDNQGIVAVNVKVTPVLATAEDHRIQLLLDGKPEGEPSQYRGQSLMGVERGKHTVAAQVLDRNDQVLITSEPVVFYLKHHAPLFYPPQADVPLPPAEDPDRPGQFYQPDQAERADMFDPGDQLRSDLEDEPPTDTDDEPPTDSDDEPSADPDDQLATDPRDRAEHLPFRPYPQPPPSTSPPPPVVPKPPTPGPSPAPFKRL